MGTIFANPLEELAEFQDMNKELNEGRGPLQVSGCVDSQKAHLISETGGGKRWKLIVTYDDSRARELFEDYRTFDPAVYLYPARDLLFYSSDIHGNLLTRQRMQVFKSLLENETGTVVTTADALMDRLLPLSEIQNSCVHVACGETILLEKLKGRLSQLGYERVGQVDGMGQFSIRGGIIDIFPLTEELPVRIELWGDEVDSIRSFDLESQRSVEELQEVALYPATELLLLPERVEEGLRQIEKETKAYARALREQMKTEQAARIEGSVRELSEEIKEGFRVHGLGGFIQYFSETTVSFLNYFPKDHLAVFLDEPLRIKEKAEVVETEFRESMAHRLEGGYLLPGQTDFLYSAKALLAMTALPCTLLLSGLDQKLSGFPVKKKYSIEAKSMGTYHNGFELLIKDLERWQKGKYRVALLTASRTRASRLANDLREYGLKAYLPDQDCSQVKAGEIMVTYGNLHRGFEYPLLKFAVVTEGDMFGNGQGKKRKKKKTSYQGRHIQSFSELSPGDYVVHENHGLGIYRGIEKIEQDKVVKDYIKIEYADGGNLYLPATKLEGIQKYAGAEAKKPKLNRLGGSEWHKTKTRVRGAVREIAKDLVKLYAARQDQEGFQYGPDTVWQREFEEMFPYEETEDQLDAIDAVKRDMESRKIMDRLICGDVGYGKTEIALRAAFKAIQEGKQVVYLVPTTILAQQHYNTFVQRMKDFPVRVDMMSRFRTPAEQKKTLEDLKKGLVDVLIGTHRVLSKDVEFKSLGLLIIDEEQRFGVAHKEKIKQLKENVDVITLTATPIPRTLHMSLIGIRDMSVLEEPPVDRLPIQTYVMEYNDEMVREAISREVARGGQVYYVYNRVNNIEEIAGHVAALVPDASVIFAHGQMREHELERIMLDFVNGEIDVLVSTTIIETGLNIPNANTIIIHDADRLGLSQLYQIRGRVGRSNRTAYAFLMYRRDKLLREEAEKRLQAIREFTELGSGIKIAMRDLEIRGAGNLLGPEQSGYLMSVGYDLYLKLLEEAVLEERGEEKKIETECAADLTLNANIPERYVASPEQRMDLYRRIAAIRTNDDASDLMDEMIDRYGEPPKPVLALLDVALLRAAAAKAGVSDITQKKDALRFTLAVFRPEALVQVCGLAKYKFRLTLSAGETPMLTLKLKPGADVLETALELVEDLKLATQALEKA